MQKKLRRLFVVFQASSEADDLICLTEDKKGVATLCRAMEEMRNETARETERAKAIKVAKGMLQSGKLSYEEIAEIAELSVDEVKALDEKVIAQNENAT